MKKAAIDSPFYFLLSVFLLLLVLYSVYSSLSLKQKTAVSDDFILDNSVVSLISLKEDFKTELYSVIILSFNQALQEYYQRQFFSKCGFSITGRGIVKEDYASCLDENFEILNSFLERRVLEEVNKHLDYKYGVIAKFDSLNIDPVSKIMVLSSEKKSLFYYPKFKNKKYYLDSSLKDNAPFLLTKIKFFLPTPDSYNKLLEYSQMVKSPLKNNNNNVFSDLEEKYLKDKNLKSLNSVFSSPYLNFCPGENSKLYNLFLDVKSILENCNEQKDDCFCGEYSFNNLEEFYPKNNKYFFISLVQPQGENSYGKSLEYFVGFDEKSGKIFLERNPSFINPVYSYTFKNFFKTAVNSNTPLFYSSKEKDNIFKIIIDKNLKLYFYKKKGRVFVSSEKPDLNACFDSYYKDKTFSTELSEEFKSFSKVNLFYNENSDYTLKFSFRSNDDFKFDVVSDKSLKDKSLFLKTIIDSFFEDYFKNKQYSYNDFSSSYSNIDLKDNDKNNIFIYVPTVASFKENFKSSCLNSDYGVDSVCFQNLEFLYEDFLKSLYDKILDSFGNSLNKKKIVFSKDVCIDLPLNIPFYNKEAKFYDGYNDNFDFFNVYPHISIKNNYVWPFNVDHIPQCYGPPPENSNLGYSFHAGIDLVPKPVSKIKFEVESFYDVKVKNVLPGKILFFDKRKKHITFFNPFGESVVVYNKNLGVAVLYGHMKSYSLPNLKVGEEIPAGFEFGFVGTSGNSKGPHLHLEFFKLSEDEAKILEECSEKGFETCGYDNFRKWYNSVVYPYRFEKTINPLCFLDSKVPVYPSGKKIDFLKVYDKNIDVKNLGVEVENTIAGKNFKDKILNPEKWSYNCIADYYAAYYNTSIKKFYSCNKI